uniref:Uncharacterized protein n=1 Tax=Parasteatoda tepidariorum TaxID=114398 RepID=A0A2L2YE91_PARTP
MRLDDFYSNILKSSEFSELFEVATIILTLSHGNAAVESGFSINKDMLVENLKDEFLVGLRTVYDAIHFYGGVLNVPLSKDLLHYAKLARGRYQQALEKQRSIELKKKSPTSGRQ